MLGKLIKHEFKSTAHSMFAIYLSALITFIVMCLVFFIKNKALMVISSVALGGICVAALVITLFAIIGTFNKSLYGNQGYLSFTLPVTGNSLLASKTVVSLCWVLISFVFAIAVTLFLIFYWVAQTSENVKSIVDTVYSMLQEMQGVPDAETALKSIIVIVVFMFIKALFLIFKVSFAITVANTKQFQKMNTILAAILVYFAVYIVLTIGNIIGTLIPVQLAVASNDIGFSIGESLFGLAQDAKIFVSIPILGNLFEFFVCILLYSVTGTIMTKHVNIK
jgi:hypothetical protein